MKVAYDKGAFPIGRAHDADAGYDIRTPIDFTVPGNGYYTVDTGVHIEIPRGYVGVLQSKSGLNVKYGLTGTGTIDSGFMGSIRVKLYNHHVEAHKFEKGDKIIQIVFYPIFTPELETVSISDFEETERGNQGFGSTGK